MTLIVCVCMCMYVYVSEVPKSLHVCVCMCIHVYVLYVSYVCACMLYVLYASAQASTDAITIGPPHPRGRRQPAGPTQDSHGQQPRHFIQRSGTLSHTRFGAPVPAARVGGAKAAPLHCPWALQSQWESPGTALPSALYQHSRHGSSDR